MDNISHLHDKAPSEPAGIWFLWVAAEAEEVMMGHWLLFAKTLVKSSLDNYVLPGTLTGTEILLVYLNQWKRDVAFMTTAITYFLIAQFESARLGEAMMPSPDESKEREENARQGVTHV